MQAHTTEGRPRPPARVGRPPLPLATSRNFDRERAAMAALSERTTLAASKIGGVVGPGFEALRDAFATSFVSGDNIGASLCAFIDGQPVVDLWGGFKDHGFSEPWTRDTLVNTFSCTKTQTAIAALLLADRGELDLDAPVAKYWPAFAAEGKSAVLVRHLLAHASGVPGWYGPITWDDVYDAEKSCAILAAQAPKWAPGTASGYHGVNYGHLVGEVIRRITGLSLGRFYATEVAGPLGADFHIGVGPELDPRVAPVLQGVPKGRPSGLNTLQDISYFNPYMPPPLTFTRAWRRAEIGGANGHGSAHGLATALSALACGGANGRRLLSEAGRMAALQTQTDGVDLCLGIPVRWGLGFATQTPLFANARRHRVAYWAGNGGSLAMVDVDARASFAFVMNRWLEGPFEAMRNTALFEAFNQCLDAMNPEGRA